MIDGGAVAQGVVTGISTQKAMQALDNVGKSGPSHQESVLQLLTEIRDALAPQEKHNHNFPMALQPSPYYYQIEDDWHGMAHFCMFVPVASSISILTIGAGLYTKTVGPGWVQVDLQGELSSGDASAHNVIISYREDAIGVSI